MSLKTAAGISTRPKSKVAQSFASQKLCGLSCRVTYIPSLIQKCDRSGEKPQSLKKRRLCATPLVLRTTNRIPSEFFILTALLNRSLKRSFEKGYARESVLYTGA